MKNVSKLKFLIIILLGVTCSSCSTIGNLVFSPHPLSEKNAPVKLVAETEVNNNKCTDVHVAGMDAVIGVALSAIQNLLEQEAKQYSASYSAATHYRDLNCLGTMLFVKGKDEKNFIIKIEADINKEKEKDKNKELPAFAFQIKKGQIHVYGVQSKVAAWPVLTLINGQNPWAGDDLSSKIGNTFGLINPLMMLHSVYGLFDSDIYKVDTKVKIRIDAISLNGNQTELKTLAETTFPVGKVEVFGIKDGKPWTNIEGDKGYFESSYLPFPVTGSTSGVTVDKFPTNLIMTVIEGNDFGDTIGKGAKLIGDKKDDIATKLKEFIGSN